MPDKYQHKKISGEGDILGNKVNLNYEGANKCPVGYIWVSGHNKKVGLVSQVYVSGHCRKISEGPEIERARGLF